MIKGKFPTSNGLVIDKNYILHTDDHTLIYVIGHIYNLPHESIAQRILDGFRKKGYNYFSTLDGRFTIIIYSQKETVIVRDRHGLHSQIYYTDDLFCSSLYELTRSADVKFTPNYNSLAFFLTSGYVKSPDSSLNNISKLEAGYILIFQKESRRHSTVNIFPAEDVDTRIEKRKSQDEYADEFYNLHKEAIRKRIIGNDKIGLFLSGGYDSGANLIALREMYAGDIFTYSIGFKDDSISELPQARLMSETFGSIHQQYEIDGTEISALPSLIRHLGDPFAECGMMVNYTVFGLSGHNFDGVLLGGEGNDHYFSSANRQMAINYLLSKVGMLGMLRGVKNLLDCDLFDKDNLFFRTNFHLGTITNIIQGEIFGFPRYQVPRLLQNESHLLPLVPIHQKKDSYESLYMQHVLKTDIEKSLNRIILFKSSKIAEMYNSHICYPFVDLDIFNFMNKLPIDLKCKGDNLLTIALGRGTPKYLHKYIYAPKMPELIAQKPKQGGFVPMAIFFKKEAQRKRMAQVILDSSICNEFLNRSEVEKFITHFDRLINEPTKWFWYKQIKCNQFFNLLSLSIWWEEYVQKKSVYL